MPVFHARIPKGRFSPEKKIAIGNALNRSLKVALGIPARDRLIVITEHGNDELFIEPTLREVERSVNAMIIEVPLGVHRPASDKTTLIAEISRQLLGAAGISPHDVFIALIPVPNENFSFGRRIDQLAGIAAEW